ncbi:hypothetical protein [Thiorhodococcus drewsii]|uniref:hypothetical protein n=1 Tax=Thiorhodococcus drewsii TaxID=210408 RepID=UPI001C1E497E|nr:hypothetical protein [Thiorhodococcus drewsii]
MTEAFGNYSTEPLPPHSATSKPQASPLQRVATTTVSTPAPQSSFPSSHPYSQQHLPRSLSEILCHAALSVALMIKAMDPSHRLTCTPLCASTKATKESVRIGPKPPNANPFMCHPKENTIHEIRYQLKSNAD